MSSKRTRRVRGLFSSRACRAHFTLTIFTGPVSLLVGILTSTMNTVQAQKNMKVIEAKILSLEKPIFV